MKLRVNGILIRGQHSPHSWERDIGTTTRIDVEMTYMKRPKADDMQYVIPIEEVVGHVHEVCGGKNHKLIETMAYAISDKLWDTYHDRLTELIIRSRREQPLSVQSMDSFEVEVRRG